MNKAQVLRDLDKHAAEFNFPMLDNDYLEFAGARLTAFQGVKDWVIVFEVIGFSKREAQFVNDLYAYGPCVSPQGIIGQEIPISSSQDHPLFDGGTNQCIADWSRWSITVDGQEMSFSPTVEEYAEAGVTIDRQPGRGSLSEIELIRFLIYYLDEKRLFLSDEALLSLFPQCKNLSKFLQTTWWQHPDVAAEEKPSENVTIRSLVEALANRTPSQFERGIPNTHWKCWAQTA